MHVPPQAEKACGGIFCAAGRRVGGKTDKPLAKPEKIVYTFVIKPLSQQFIIRQTVNCHRAAVKTMRAKREAIWGMGKPKKLRRLIKAAKMGKPYAMYALGLRHAAGRGTAQDMTAAADWIAAAAAAGCPAAKAWIEDYTIDDDAWVQAES